MATTRESTPRHLAVILTLATALLLPLLASSVQASEELPSGVKFPNSEAQQKVKAYQGLSRTILKDRLTPLVEKTREGEVALGGQWMGHCNKALKALAKLKKDGAIPDSLNEWYTNEQKAWLNVRTIGDEMMDHHYLMASTREEIEQDAKDCEAFFKFWKNRVSKANDEAGQINDLMTALNGATGHFDKIGGIVGDISDNLGDLQEYAFVISRVLRVFRARKFQFIKENDLTVKYRDKLAKLKNKQIDPDATGVFHEAEKKWEETMTSTYLKYVSAVANWNKAARWWLTKDELAKLTFSLGSKMAKMAAGNMLGFPLPSTSLADPEKLGDWILKMRGTLTKAVEKARGMEWARLDTEILDAEEERRALNVVFQEEIEAADMEARMQAVGVDQKHESALKSLERESQKAHLKLAKAGTDEQQERTAMADIIRIEERMMAEERAVQKEKRYWLEDWYKEQEEKAYDKLEAAVRKIDERIKELKAEKPR